MSKLAFINGTLKPEFDAHTGLPVSIINNVTKFKFWSLETVNKPSQWLWTEDRDGRPCFSHK